MSREEKYFSPKELSAEFRELGITASVRYVISILRAGAPHSQVGARMFARASEVIAWWHEHPDFRPRSRRYRDAVDRAQTKRGIRRSIAKRPGRRRNKRRHHRSEGMII